MATLLPASGAPRTVTPANGRAFTLRELQTFVGGYIQGIGTPDGRLMFLNEDGKQLGLPPNLPATDMVRAWLLPFDIIVGDVILCTRDEAK